MPYAYPIRPTWNPRRAPRGCKGYWLASAGCGDGVRDLSPGRQTFTIMGDPSTKWARGRYGWELGNNREAVIANPRAAIVANPYPSWYAALAVNSGTGDYWLFAESAGGGVRSGFPVNSGGAGNGAYLVVGAGGSADCTASGLPVNDGRPHVFFGLSLSATDHSFWFDGRKVATSTTNPGVVAATQTNWGYLQYGGGNVNHYGGSIQALMVGNGAVPDPRALAADLLSGRFSAVRPRSSSDGLAGIPAPAFKSWRVERNQMIGAY